MPVQLKIRWDLTMNELVSMKQDGFLIFKTPHVGNWYPNNLACAYLGIHSKVVDTTKGCLDKNFHPHRLIRGGVAKPIAPDDTLIRHALVSQSYEQDGLCVPVGEYVSRVHMDALKKAIPHIQAQLLIDYISEHADLMMRMLACLSRKHLNIWNRKVLANGHTINSTPSSWEQVIHDGVSGIDGCVSGWCIPNIAHILTDIVIDPLVHGNIDQVFELSGPDMYRYVGDLMPQVIAMYDLVRTELALPLPEVMHFHIVPVSDLRFAVPLFRKEALCRLVDVWLQHEWFELDAGIRIREASQENHSSMIRVVAEERRKHAPEFVQAIRQCPDPFYTIEDGTFFSQYDLLDHQGLFIHPWALETSFGKLTDAVRAMRRFL